MRLVQNIDTLHLQLRTYVTQWTDFHSTNNFSFNIYSG